MSRPHDQYRTSTASSLGDQPPSPLDYPPRAGGRVLSTASSDYDYPATSPSLPRYSSALGYPSVGPPSSDYSSRPASSPLNPSARGVLRGYGGAHPLSNEYNYTDSNPTLNDPLEKVPSAAGTPASGHRPGFPSSPRSKGGFFTTLYRAISGANVADSGLDERHVKKKRLGYLDGLKLLAALVVMNATLFDAVLSDQDYSAIQRSSPLFIARSFDLGMVTLLLLSGRCLIAPLWDAPNPHAPPTKNVDPRKPLISWARLTRAMLVRPARFVLPVIVVAAIQWGLGASGATKTASDVGIDEPYWNNIRSFSGYLTLVFDLFTYFEVDTTAGKAFAGNLWTNAWFFQSSYCVYVVHFMLGNLSSNRYWVYALLMLFSWTTYNFFCVALAGLFIADMAAHGQTARIRKWSIVNKIALWLILTAIACATQFIGVVRDHLNSAMATINVTRHTEIAFADLIFAIALVFIVETSEVAHKIFGNPVVRSLGRLSPGLYLLATPVTFGLIPKVALSLHNNGSKASTVLGISWAVLFGATFALSIPFHFLVECPSKLLGEYLADYMENAGAEKVKPVVAASRGQQQLAAQVAPQPGGNLSVNPEAHHVGS